MSIHEDFREPLEKLESAMESFKERVRNKLMGLSKEDRFRIMRQDLSMASLELLCEWALPDEDYEICATMMDVKSNNEAEFFCRFTFVEPNDGKAKIVRFTDAEDGKVYYHADFVVNDVEGSVVMLHKGEDGIWSSEWKSNDPVYFDPIGTAIEVQEKK